MTNTNNINYIKAEKSKRNFPLEPGTMKSKIIIVVEVHKCAHHCPLTSKYICVTSILNKFGNNSGFCVS